MPTRPRCGEAVRYTLRAVTAEDEDWLYELNRAALGSYVEQIWGKWDELWQRQYFHEHFDPGVSRIVVYRGQDVGILRVEERIADVAMAVIELLPAFQRMGIGTTVISEVRADAHRRHLPVVLQVFKVNPARRLYERLGFVVSGETATHYQMIARPAGQES
jgi:ribosomal protein S18 acetylase RimI-like enzyme